MCITITGASGAHLGSANRQKGKTLSHTSVPPVQQSRHTPTSAEFIATQKSPEFQELRRLQRGFTFPLAIAGMVWFVVYIVTAMYAPHIITPRVFGLVNVGILLGLGQFISTFLITWLYVRYADKNLEPRSRAVRESLEGA